MTGGLAVRSRMTKTRCFHWWGWGVLGLLGGATLTGGCHGASRCGPASITNPALGPMSIAVAPALNLSGSADFDRNRFADLMASELGGAEGISVIPVSRVLGILAAQGRGNVESYLGCV